MDRMTNPSTAPRRLPGGPALRRITPPAGLAMAGLVLFLLALVAGVVVADLVAPESEAILAAPFRW